MSNMRSTEELIAMYTKQSAGGFFSTAMSVPITDEPVKERKFVSKGCDWPCCNDEGDCKPVCYVCLVAVVGIGFACCCYLTNGFGGQWPYWPF
ncbi:MAG: hypothetical protein FWD37_03195 [Methanomassiliicoccaceae archaeon]|nr:hypothetical protein [Methanomassiliicoccaceae archaeon]